jgi:hypothetical protein
VTAEKDNVLSLPVKLIKNIHTPTCRINKNQVGSFKVRDLFKVRNIHNFSNRQDIQREIGFRLNGPKFILNSLNFRFNIRF